MSHSHPLMPAVTDEAASDRVKAVFDDIRATRNTDFINNFWRVVANDPAQLERTWAELKVVMAPGALDPLTKELIYTAVSIANSCEYCIRSHSTAAAAKGATPEMITELLAVVTAATKTNRLAIGWQIPVDEAYLPAD